MGAGQPEFHDHGAVPVELAHVDLGEDRDASQPPQGHGGEGGVDGVLVAVEPVVLELTSDASERLVRPVGRSRRRKSSEVDRHRCANHWGVASGLRQGSASPGNGSLNPLWELTAKTTSQPPHPVGWS